MSLGDNFTITQYIQVLIFHEKLYTQSIYNPDNFESFFEIFSKTPTPFSKWGGGAGNRLNFLKIDDRQMLFSYNQF